MDEAIESSPLRSDWVVPPPSADYFSNPQEAIKFAHALEQKMQVVEYGVTISPEVIEDL